MRSKALILSGLWMLATPCLLPAASVILNEYNAVGSTSRLDAGAGRDMVFGSIFGNGGNWFELLVIDDVDMRGWSMEWHEEEVTMSGALATGTLTLSNGDLWSDVKRGTILTFIETQNAGDDPVLNTSTDTSFDPASNDWWINVSTREEATKGAAALVTTTTNHGAPGDFSTGNNNWYLTILDAQGSNVFGPVGEGALGWPGPGINNEEAVKLEGPDPFPVSLETWHAVTPTSEFYDDTGTTSFGQLSHSYDPVSQTFAPLQDLSALRGPVGPVAGDFNDDGQLTATDIDLLSAEVRAGTNTTTFDLNSDSLVNEQDRVMWVDTLRKTYFGDANLDGQFSSSDLVEVLASGAYEADLVAGWASGDFDGNERTNSSDLVTALASGGYEAGPRAAVASVPEPSAWGLLSAGLLLGRRVIRRRR